MSGVFPSSFTCALLIVFASFVFGCSPKNVCADFPSHPITIDLGPGNEQMNEELHELLSKGFSNFAGTGLRSAVDLSGRDLRRATIHLALESLHGVKFDGANFTGADISETVFENCSFRGAILRKIYSQAGIRPTCDLTDADISGSLLGLTSNQIESTRNYKNKDLSYTVFGGDFRGLSFAGFNLRGTVCDDGSLLGCDFEDADISRSCIKLTSKQLRATKNYKSKDLSNTILKGNFLGLSFAGFDLSGAVFKGANLEGCDFSDSNIGRASFVFEGSPVDGRFPKQVLITKQQLYSTRSYREKDLDQVLFHGCDLRHVDFSCQNLGEFRRCDLSGASFDNAAFPKSLASETALPFDLGNSHSYLRREFKRYGVAESNMTAEQFYSTRTYQSKQLPQNFSLRYMNMKGWDFSGMDLRFVSFDGSSLKGANLTDARGGMFKNSLDLTLEQVKTTWNYRNNDMKTTGFSLPKEVADALQ